MSGGTLWECLLSSANSDVSLRAHFLLLMYQPGWGVYDRPKDIERRACPLAHALAAKKKKGRPGRAEAAERKMVEAWRAGLPAQYDLTSDLIIAVAYDLIVHQWGFPRRPSADALGKAAASVLTRTCPNGLPLSGERIRQIAALTPGVRSYRSVYTKKMVIGHRPTAIQGYTSSDLNEVCTRVIECHGHVPPEWEEICLVTGDSAWPDEWPSLAALPRISRRSKMG